MSEPGQDVMRQFENLEPEEQAAQLAVMLDKLSPQAARQVGLKASGQARRNILAIVAGVPERPRSAATIVAIAILGGLSIAGLGLGAATVFSGFESAPFFGFAGAALGVLGGLLAPASFTRWTGR
jgi:hypothetical protein